MANDQQELELSMPFPTDICSRDYEICRNDWDFLLNHGFITRANFSIFFIREKDILDLRYPLHYIKRAEGENLEKLWCIEWDRIAYNVYRIQSEACKLNIPSGIASVHERIDRDRWIVTTPSMNVHEAIIFYDLLNESRFSR